MEINCKASFCLLVGILLVTVERKLGICSGEGAEAPPEIFLEQYKSEKSNSWDTITDENSFPNFIRKDESEFSVSSNTSDIPSHYLLSCRASYPVYWLMMANVKPTLLDEIKTDFKVVFDFEDEEQEEEVAFNATNLEAREFWSYLILYNDVSFTGLYTCRSVEETNMKTSTYVFLPGLPSSNAQVLLQAGQKVMVGVNGQQSVLLPCKASQPTVGISVAKRDADGNWTPLQLKTKFDPKRGWILNKDDVSALTGQYKCTVAEEELIIDVLNEYQEDEQGFSMKNDTSGEVKWGYQTSGIYEGTVECCSNGTEAPNLIVVECDNMPHCNMKGEALLRLRTNETSNIPGLEEISSKWRGDPCVHTRNDIHMRSFLIQCIGDGVDVSGQFAMEFGPPAYKKMKSVSFTSIQNLSYSEKAVIETNFWRWENSTDGPVAPRIDILKTDIYSGERLLIDCCGLHSFHATGRIQRIGWENGTLTTLPTPEQIDSPDRPYLVDFCNTYRYGSDFEDYMFTLEQNMSYFECIVPRWYTKRPAIRRVSLNVKASEEPVIFQNVNANDEVTVIYNENQLGLLQLKCELFEGAPPPKVQWRKDGYKLNQTDLNWSVVEASELAGVNLLFMRATKEIEGQYECTASNWKGFDTRTYTVKVIPRSYIDYWVALVVFGGFFAMIICCGTRISTLEKQMTSKKQVDPINIPEISLNEK